MRNNRPDSIQSAIAAAYKANGGLENTASDIGVSTALLSLGTRVDEKRQGGLGVNYLDRLSRMHRPSALPLAQHFCALGGGVFQPLEASGPGCLITLSGDAAKEFGDVVASALRAKLSMSTTDCDDTILQIDEAMGVLVRMRAEAVRQRGR
ncbi:hypothetical protein [Limimaricola cinnabarinus]|uniref:Uncharacterized protein n=1 Tax=Limimaricola cinnabarinus TaxID=1125964 RepID=A0A2G1MGY8_9RHOB|nr:hypothetical protein [Limimaricola cinnabarinus]PHP28019.1 hypothetical protein CJ301_08525 [Limimaricola cinnabarinus]